jgi:hypothetical protein
VVPEIAQILGNGVLIRGEGSKQLSSQQRCDHFSVSYSGVLKFGGVTFDELPGPWRKNVSNCADEFHDALQGSASVPSIQRTIDARPRL